MQDVVTLDRVPEVLIIAAIVVAALAGGGVAWRVRRGARASTRPVPGAPAPAKPTGPVPKPPRTRPVPTVKAGTAPPPRAAEKSTRTPRVGEVWIAKVPFHGEPGSKVRPCVVLRVTDQTAEVLKITSQNHLDQGDHIVLDPASWDPQSTHTSYLDLSDPYQVPFADFRRRRGVVDDAAWAVVRQWHKVPALTRSRAAA